MTSSFPQELVLGVLRVSEGMMAIIPPIIRGTEGCRGPYEVRWEHREAQLSQPAVEVGCGGLRDWTPVSSDDPGLGETAGTRPGNPALPGAYGPGGKPLGQCGVCGQGPL